MPFRKKKATDKTRTGRATDSVGYSRLEDPSGRQHDDRGIRNHNDKDVDERQRIVERTSGDESRAGRRLVDDGGPVTVFVVIEDNAEMYDDFQYWVNQIGYSTEEKAVAALTERGFKKDRYGTGYSRVVASDSLERYTHKCNKYSGLQKARIAAITIG